MFLLEQHSKGIIYVKTSTDCSSGQISGFLEMRVFLEAFGEKSTDLEAHPSGYYFSNVRSGLIVGLVRVPILVTSSYILSIWQT